MNAKFHIRLVATAGLILAAGFSNSCTTTYYDDYGYPHQAVDPGLAIAGLAAAGVLGYALADSYDHHHHRHHYRNYHYDYDRPGRYHGRRHGYRW